MPREPRAFLWDVRDAADAIADFVAGIDFAAYQSTPLIYSAVERKFEIIGEALSQLAKADRALVARIAGFEQIIAFRNLLIHGYALVDHRRVWGLATKSLPELRAVVDHILRELGEP